MTYSTCFNIWSEGSRAQLWNIITRLIFSKNINQTHIHKLGTVLPLSGFVLFSGRLYIYCHASLILDNIDVLYLEDANVYREVLKKNCSFLTHW